MCICQLLPLFVFIPVRSPALCVVLYCVVLCGCADYNEFGPDLQPEAIWCHAV